MGVGSLTHHRKAALIQGSLNKTRRMGGCIVAASSSSRQLLGDGGAFWCVLAEVQKMVTVTWTLTRSDLPRFLFLCFDREVCILISWSYDLVNP